MKKKIVLILCLALFFSGCQTFKPVSSNISTDYTEDLSILGSSKEPIIFSTETSEATELSDFQYIQKYQYMYYFVENGVEEYFRQHVQDPAILESFPYVPPMYTYQSPSGSIVYLFGTSQAYDAETLWFPVYAQAALEGSQCLVTAHPEINYSDDDLSYAAALMAQKPEGFTEELMEYLELYRKNRNLGGPEVTEVRPLYWFLTKNWKWSETQMNDAIWDMAAGKERILSYTGRDVIDRMNQLSAETEAILAVSNAGRNLNTDSSDFNEVNRYYSWLAYGCYYDFYSNDWWDDRFSCDGNPDNAEVLSKIAEIPIDESCNGLNCASTHFAKFYSEYYSVVFLSNCQDIVDSINISSPQGPIFVAVDLIYLYEIASNLVQNGWVQTERFPFSR